MGCWVYKVCSNDDSRLTMTYLTLRSNLIPHAFKLKKVEVAFLKPVEASIYLMHHLLIGGMHITNWPI